MAILGVPMLLGPIIGGWLIQVAGWHWIFLVNAPIGLIAIIHAWRVLPSDTPEPSAMVLLTVIPAMVLPRRHEETHLLDDEGIPPVIVH